MLILMVMFLVIVVYHARLIEVTSRLDFLWKLQAETDLDEMEDTQKTNRHLLKHILPDHVVNHFLSKESVPDVSVYFLAGYSRIVIKRRAIAIYTAHDVFSRVKGFADFALLSFTRRCF